MEERYRAAEVRDIAKPLNPVPRPDNSELFISRF
jgi:hypothetical protein